MSPSTTADGDRGDTFPRQYARTQRFTLGEPRNISVSPDGERVVFARSRAGDDPTNCLWVLDVASGEERLVADPVQLTDLDDSDNLPAEERARRERLREGAAGVTAYATDEAVRVAAFTLGGKLFVAGLLSAQARPLVVDGPVFDPRPAPDASRLAYVRERSLYVAELDGSSWELAGEVSESVAWGSAEFIAAEEMGRQRGFWWSPDSNRIAACRVDTSPVNTWYIANPAEPEQAPSATRYPAAGTQNAAVSVHVLALDGGAVEVLWDVERYPYVVDVNWPEEHRLLVTVQSRDQRQLAVLEANPDTGDTAELFVDSDDTWVELVGGVPRLLGDARLVMTADRDGARRLLVDGTPVTPADLQVRSVVGTHGTRVVFIANPLTDATIAHVWQWDDGELTCLTEALGPGVHGAAGVAAVVLRRASLDESGTRTWIGETIIESHAQTPLVTPRVQLQHLGQRSLATAVLLPTDHDGSPLPVLMDPYGGPHAQRAVAAYNAHLSSQWFADQGFAVVVVDGRGTPGRGTEWERSVHLDLATPVLDDQVDALRAAAERFPLDLDRVAIRGWSFGGYLAALAVLRRPDVFHAAVAGAPVTEWRLYDTHYTERYLGNPSIDAGPYAATSLLPLADELTRPLLLIHGLADDNVVAAHTLQLSQALLAAGRPHEVLPLVGVTHMTPQEVVAENLLLHQLHFLQRSLGLVTN